MPTICNGLEACRVALKAGESDLASPDFAACHAGVNYYHAMLDQLRAEFEQQPFTFSLCCGDDPAIAHDALRMGLTPIRIRCTDGIFTQLQQVAAQCGAVVVRNA